MSDMLKTTALCTNPIALFFNEGFHFIMMLKRVYFEQEVCVSNKTKLCNQSDAVCSSGMNLLLVLTIKPAYIILNWSHLKTKVAEGMRRRCPNLDSQNS